VAEQLQIKEIINDYFWDTWKIPRPELIAIAGEEFQSPLEDREMDIKRFEKQKIGRMKFNVIILLID